MVYLKNITHLLCKCMVAINLFHFDVEALLYVQEAQLDKFRQELAISNVLANLVHVNSQTDEVCETYEGNYGRGCMNCGREHGQWSFSSGSRPTCKFCGKYGHVIVDSWHRFDENFTPTNASFNMHAFSSLTDQA